MNFFKRFFSKKSKKEATLPVNPPASPPPAPPSDFPTANAKISTEAAPNFEKRFRAMNQEVDHNLLNSALEMIGNYALISKLELPNKSIPNHPENLDFAVNNGYLDWLRSVGMGDGDIAAQLCFALSEYMVKHFDMALFHDHVPEYKFRVFTLIKKVNEKRLSIYPLEFTIKVMTAGEAFVAFETLFFKKETEIMKGLI